MYDKEKAKNYYQKNKAYILQVHQAWAKKNVDHTGSVWRLYGRRRRNKNPNIDKEYRLRKKYRQCIGLYPITSQLKLLK